MRILSWPLHCHWLFILLLLPARIGSPPHTEIRKAKKEG